MAAKLCQWRIDILSESDSATKTAEAIFNLMLIPNMTETMAQNIFQSGYASFSEIAESAPAEIMLIPGYSEESKAMDLINASQGLVDEYEAEGKEVPTMAAKLMKEGKTISAPSTEGSSKQQAEERLKEELMQLENAEAEATESEVEEIIADADPVDGESDETSVVEASESTGEAEA